MKNSVLQDHMTEVQTVFEGFSTINELISIQTDPLSLKNKKSRNNQ